MTETETDYAAKVRNIVPDLEYTAEFVPQSKSRNAGEKHPSLNWKVTFKRNRLTLTTDHMQGIGHLKPQFEGWSSYGRKSNDQDRAEKNAAEKGTTHNGFKKLPPPVAHDVLHCLLLDAEVINAGRFEEWANELGYDTDSRKAEAIYKACLEIGLQLRRMLGDDKITALREALADL